MSKFFATVTHLETETIGNQGFANVGYLRDGDRVENTQWLLFRTNRGENPVIGLDRLRKAYRVGKRLTEDDV